MLRSLFGRKPAAKIAEQPPLPPAPAAQPVGEPATETPVRGTPPHILAFESVLDRIVSDVTTLGDRARQGMALHVNPGRDAIYCDDVEGLFTHQTPDGATHYAAYAYTQDLRTMDPNAQVHLSNFFGRIMTLNAALCVGAQPALCGTEPGFRALHDDILLDAYFFKGFFRAFDLTTCLLMRSVSPEEAGTRFRSLIDQSKADFAIADRFLFDPERAFENLPQTSQQLIIETRKPHEDGQITINGVYFDRAMGARMLAFSAERQAHAMGQ